MRDYFAFRTQWKEKRPTKTFLKKHQLGCGLDHNLPIHKGRFSHRCLQPNFNWKGGDKCQLRGIIAVPLILKMTLDKFLSGI